MKNYIRMLTANILTPVMKLTGFRFSRAYRRGDTRYHQIIFACVDCMLCQKSDRAFSIGFYPHGSSAKKAIISTNNQG